MALLATKPDPRLGLATRQTRPAGFNLNQQGGLAIIPRRGFEGHLQGTAWQGALTGKEALLTFAALFPGRISEILGSYHPTAAKAQSNWLAAGAGPGSVKLACYVNGADGTDQRDDGATAEIDDFLVSLGSGIGGLNGLRIKGALCLLHYGLFPLEAVPSARGRGLSQIGLVDPVSIDFGLDDSGVITPAQRQSGAPNGRVILSPETFFWAAHSASVTNPYGLPVFSSAVAECLKDLHFDQDVADSVHNAAWQRYVYKYSMETLYKIATSPPEMGGLGLPSQAMAIEGETYYAPYLGAGDVTYVNPAREWVMGELALIDSYFAELSPDSNLRVDSSGGGGVDNLAAASFDGLDPVIEHKDYRLVRALDEMPTTMGSPKSGAQTFTTAEWGIQAAKQQALREEVMAPILDCCNLHFRLQGKPVTVKAEYEIIRTSDAVADATAESVTASTWTGFWQTGLISKEELSLKLTGSGLPESDPNAYVAPVPAAAPGADPQLPAGGTTQEEKQAQKDAQKAKDAKK